jgi:hypothetical protein
VPQANRVTTKESKVLKKFRRVFSVSRIEPGEVEVVRKDPDDPTKNITMKFGFRGIGFEDYQWVLEKSVDNMHSQRLATFSFKEAVIAIGTCSLDGVPMWEVFGFEPDDPADVADPMLPKHRGLRQRPADLFLEELKTTFYDAVEYLYTQYEEKVDTQYLPTRKKEEDVEEEESGPLAQTESES